MDADDLVGRAARQWRAARPDLDPSPVLVIGRMSRLARFLHQDLVALYAEFGLAEPDFDILATLRRSGAPFELGQSELTRATFVTKGAVSKRLDALEGRGLIVRTTSADDARGRDVRLTDAGRELVDRAVVAHFENERRMLEAVPESDRAELERILAAWVATYEAAHRAGR